MIKQKISPTLLTALISTLSTSVLAHDLIDERPKPLTIIPTETAPSHEPNSPVNPTEVNIDEQTLTQNPALTQTIILSALKHKQWELVGELLPIYHAGHGDTLIYHIAGAGFARFNKNYKQSFAHYEQILIIDPTLANFRLDYVTALIEDKRHKDAQIQLDALMQSPLADTHGALLKQLNEYLDNKNNWQHHASANFIKTDNVNGASSERYLQVGGRQFEKNKDSLPKKATGLSYDIDTQKSTNITGNHYWTMTAGVSGVAYWDNSDFNEMTTTLKTGYRHQTHEHTINIEPFIDYTLFDDKAYRRQVGLSGNLWHSLSPRHQMSFGASISHQDHFDQATANTYDGTINEAHATWYFLARPHWLIYAGVDTHIKHASHDMESYHKQGIKTGMQFTHPTLPSTRLNVHFGKRTHEAPHPFFNQIRTDNQTNISSAIWYPKWQYKGYTPMLNYQYTKIDSNIDALYSRENQSWFISVQKMF